MRVFARSLVVAIVCALAAPAWSADSKAEDNKDKKSFDDANMKPQSVATENSVTVGGQKIDYKAVAGTIILTGKDENKDDPTASMFYAAYFKHSENGAKRPITFFYNGGPGSSTVWLHMGAFGPKRVVTPGDQHTPAAPYNIANNNFSLLDATDLVFIDAPGTGFSRLLSAEADKDKREKQLTERKKEFYGVDPDGQAFAQFIVKFLTQYQRWNSPKYLFGESYGTTRSAVLVEHSGDAGKRRSERRYPVVADSVVSATTSMRRSSIPASIRPMRSRCRRMRRARGITIACRISRKI